MVATPSKKKSKLTYADRVVRVLSEYQRAHKKHAIHLATLRAQVRKDADADKDQLGAQWSHWVTRAVNKLVDQGVLEAEDGQYYTFSTQTKKSLVAARRQPLSAAPGTPSRADQLWRSVVTGNHASRGTKRRHSTAVPDFEEPETPSRSISTRRKSSPRKKARRSSIKGISRMTKAELLEALHNAEDQESEQVQRLREELAALRHQLEDTRREDSISSAPPSYGRCPTPETPVPVRETSNLEFSRVTETVSISARRPIAAITRTESGSIIPEATRQPTPAPSDLDDDVNMNHDPFQYNPAESCSQQAFGLATPTYTPLTSRTNLPSVADDGVRSLLESRMSELQTLRVTHDKLAAEHAILKDDIATRESRTSALQFEVKEKTDLLAAQQQELSGTRLDVLRLQSEVSTLTTAMQDNMAALADARKALEVKEVALNTLASEKAQLEAKLAETERALEALKVKYEQSKLEGAKSEAELEQKLALAYETEASLQSELKKRQDETVALESRNQALEANVLSVTEQLTAAKTDIVDLTARLATADSAIEGLARERDAAIAKHDAARDELAAVQVTMATLQEELALLRETAAHREAEVAGLAARLAVSEKDVASLREQLDAERAGAAALAGEKDATVAQLAAVRKELDDTIAQLRTLSEELVEKDAAVANLEGSVQSAQAQVGDLTAQVEQLEADKIALQLSAEEFKETLAAKEARLADINEVLKTQQEVSEGLESQLATSVARNADLAAELSAKVDALDAAQEQLQAAQTTEDELRAKLVRVRMEAEEAGRVAAERVAALETSLQAAHEKAASLEARLQSAEQAHEALACRFEQSTADLATAQAALQAEQDRATALDVQVAAMLVEKETLARQWAEVKVRDDDTIGKLRQLVQRHEAFFRSQVEEISRESSSLIPASPPVEMSTLRVEERSIAYAS